MNRVYLIWLVLLASTTLASGVAVVYAKNMSRVLFVETQKIRVEHDLTVAEWGRLQLELASEGSLEDVMRIAEGRLKMRPPIPSERVIID
tara:strand:+ start:3000 stop:3269 length:270 start_codon:yes stop_codon:yes gene_type:complete